ncbi:hypothetical protein PoB_005833400 [Plakobranchus ocellatus]|uniref:Uncharacterized protein n=1 Tax=Plakobranchus ocellatus TaxID=259542 RepID=A0AAV4CLD3_9GAST|nr:hypothetical protein PoB_005833400 [Plakobranchus ocellatus]
MEALGENHSSQDAVFDSALISIQNHQPCFHAFVSSANCPLLLLLLLLPPPPPPPLPPPPPPCLVCREVRPVWEERWILGLEKPCTEAARGAASVASKRKAEDLPTLMSVSPFAGWSPFKKFIVISSKGSAKVIDRSPLKSTGS